MIDVCASVSITGKMFGWSKWGGANQGLFTLLPADEWWCQCCGDKQTKNMPSYMVPFDFFNRDFAKVCATCRHRFLLEKLKTFFELKSPKRV